MTGTASKPTARPRRCRPPRRGLVLPLVLLAVAIAFILGSCFLASAATATASSSAAAQRLRARMIAESGLAMSLAYLERDVNWRTNRPNGVWVSNRPLDGGTFTVSGEDGDRVNPDGTVAGDGSLFDDPTDPVVVTSVGTYRGTRYRVRAVRYPTKAKGITVNERVELRKSSLIDSFLPANGPYSAATATAAALVKSNGLSRQPYIKLLKNARVNGNVYFGPGGSLARAVQQDASAVVTGAIAALPMAVAMPDIVEPDWPVNGSGVGASYSSGTTVLKNDLWCDQLTVSGTATLRAVGNVNVYVDGDVTVTDDARIEVGDLIAYAAAAKGTITLNATVPIDSYNSAAGPYGGTNVSAKALVATNAATAAAVTVGSAVKGDVYSGVGSVPATSIVVTTGSDSGARAALTTALAIPSSPAPLPKDFPASVGDYLVKNATPTLNADLQTNNLQIDSNGVLRVSGNRRIRVNGDLTLVSNGSIDIPSGSSLVIYVVGAVRINGNGVVANTGKSPQQLLIYATGSNPVDLTGVADVYAVIDAPHAPVTMSGAASLYGAVMGASLATSNTAALHHDRNPAVVDANPRMPSTCAPGSKLTIYANKHTVFQKNAQVNTATHDPLCLTINHLGAELMEVKDLAVAFAEANVPEMTLSVGGTARWTGRVTAQDLVVGGTAVVSVDGSGGTDRPGLLIEETVQIKDGAVINGTGGAALVASHGATDTTVWVKDTGTLKADADTAPGGSPADEIRVAPTATFTGNKGALMIPANVAALTAPAVTGSISDRTVAGTTSVTLTGDVFCKKFTAQDSAVVEVAGTTRLILTGDFVVCKNARLVLRPDATLTVYCPTNVKIVDSARVNAGGDPGRLTISSPITPKIELKNTVSVTATLLAPLAELKVNDSAEFVGAFAGRRLKLDHTGKFHCAQNQNGPIIWLEQQ